MTDQSVTINAIKIPARPWEPITMVTITRPASYDCLRALVGGYIEAISFIDPLVSSIDENVATLWGHEETKYLPWMENRRAEALVGWPAPASGNHMGLANDFYLLGFNPSDGETSSAPEAWLETLSACAEMRPDAACVPQMHESL